jgi:hypothetical protein
MADPMRKRLHVRWSQKERALLYHHPDSSSNGGMLAYYFEGIRYPGDKTLAQELDARGYDVKTLRFSVQKKATAQTSPPRKPQ